MASFIGYGRTSNVLLSLLSPLPIRSAFSAFTYGFLCERSSQHARKANG